MILRSLIHLNFGESLGTSLVYVCCFFILISGVQCKHSKKDEGKNVTCFECTETSDGKINTSCTLTTCIGECATVTTITHDKIKVKMRSCMPICDPGGANLVIPPVQEDYSKAYKGDKIDPTRVHTECCQTSKCNSSSRHALMSRLIMFLLLFVTINQC